MKPLLENTLCVTQKSMYNSYSSLTLYSLRNNDKDAACTDFVHKTGVAFVTLSSLRDQLHNDVASEFLHTMQNGLDEYETCREVKQVYREGVQAENIETRKLENMKNSNDLVKLKKQEKDTEDRKIA